MASNLFSPFAGKFLYGALCGVGGAFLISHSPTNCNRGVLYDIPGYVHDINKKSTTLISTVARAVLGGVTAIFPVSSIVGSVLISKIGLLSEGTVYSNMYLYLYRITWPMIPVVSYIEVIHTLIKEREMAYLGGLLFTMKYAVELILPAFFTLVYKVVSSLVTD